jgi:rod shape-determining protein MreD
MDKSLRFMLVSSLLLAVAVVLQSTALEYVAIGGVKPDLALIVLVFVAVHGGPMAGQVSGFIAGLVQDFLSLPPLGMSALVRTTIGFVYGRLQGALAAGSVLAPVVLVLLATVMKGALLWLAASLFAPAFRLGFTVASLIELGYNSLLAPLLFAVLGRIRALRETESKEGSP